MIPAMHPQAARFLETDPGLFFVGFLLVLGILLFAWWLGR